MSTSTSQVVKVAATRLVCPEVRELRLTSLDGTPLMAFQPGAHITLDTPVGGRSYSLTGDGFSPDSYTIAVRLQAEGSAWVHGLETGDDVHVTRPRSNFGPVLTAKRHLLIAGGIGITPILSHLRSAHRWGREVQVIYGFSSGRSAFVDELSTLAGEHVTFAEGRHQLSEAIEDALRNQPIGTHLYACGPAGLLDCIESGAQEAGWPSTRVHTEHFQAAALDPGDAFSVRVASLSSQVQVASGVSMLQALEDAGVQVQSMCRQGVCGECRTGLLHVDGCVVHRDLLQSAAEKSKDDTIYPCVSRGTHGSVLELDL